MLEMPYLKKSTFPCTIMHQNMSSNLRKIAKRMARAKILVLSFCMFCLPNVSIGNTQLKKELKNSGRKVFLSAAICDYFSSKCAYAFISRVPCLYSSKILVSNH